MLGEMPTHFRFCTSSANSMNHLVLIQCNRPLTTGEAKEQTPSDKTADGKDKEESKPC